MRRLFLCAWLTSGLGFGQGVITTVAGTDFVFPSKPLPAVDAPLGRVSAVAVDNRGNLYIADPGSLRVMKVDTSGVLTVVAGNGFYGFSGDGGPAISAALAGPEGLAVDASGSLFIADTFNNRIRKVTPEGLITTVAGNGNFGFSGDGGPATNAALLFPGGVAVDAAGNLFIADANNLRIRKVTPAGIITTVAGNGSYGFSGDGEPATSAALAFPSSVAVDAEGNLFIADSGNRRIRKVSPSGIITTVAGGGSDFLGDGRPATSAGLYLPTGVAADAAGNFFIVDTRNSRIRKITPSGIITTVAGGGSEFPGDGGPAISVGLRFPVAAALDAAGNLFIADAGDHRVRKVSPAGIISTAAGNGSFGLSGDGGPATSSALAFPFGLALDAGGNLFFADQSNHRIRKVTPVGIITTVAGNGAQGFSGDGVLATGAFLAGPSGVALDAAGNLFIADTLNNRIRKVTPEGIITTVAGNGQSGFSRDGGLATSAALDDPTGVAVDAAGNLFIAESRSNRIRKVTPAGIITTVAGTGVAGFSGDGGPATSATLFVPYGVTLDAAGNLFIADHDNNRIRRVTPAGIITTVAGNGREGFSGDGGPALSAALFFPGGVKLDVAGNLYIADSGNNRIRKVTPAGIITTVAGNRLQGFSGDGGPATSAALFAPLGIEVDAAGNLFIGDYANHRIRKVLSQPPSFAVSTRSLNFSGASQGAPSNPQRILVDASVPAVEFTASLSGVSWLAVTPTVASTPRLLELTADPEKLAPGEYRASITFRAANALPAEHTVAVGFTVGPALPPGLQVDKDHLSFNFPRSAVRRAQALSVANGGSGALPFSASAVTSSGGAWLVVSPADGVATPRAPVALSVQADPVGLPPGTYTGTITISTQQSGASKVTVTMTISTLDKAILLSQTGLSFTAVAGGGLVPPQEFGILNIGTGVMPWTISTSTLSGGPAWLATSARQGSTDPVAIVPTASVPINQAGLAPGRYYGLVRVDAPGAANTPHVLTTSLEVLPPDANPGSVVQPSELIFNAVEGADSPGSQDILVYNLTPGSLSYRSSVTAGPLDYTPLNASILPQEPARIVVQPFTGSLRAGNYRATITLQFSDGIVREVPVQLIVSAGSAGLALQSSKSTRRHADGCVPTKLLPVFHSLGQASSVPAGWPAAIVVQVKDDCGSPLNTGVVRVSFSNGDQPVLMQSLNDGRWHGTWQSRNARQPEITVTADAREPARNLQGASRIRADVRATQNPPLLDSAAVVSVANATPNVPLAPGSIITIYGQRLAETTETASTVPLPDTLGQAVVVMAGKALPLLFAGENQINAIVPYDLQVDTTHQILVRRGLTYGNPVQVDVARAQPAIFATAQPEGNRAIAAVVRATGGQSQQFQAAPETPATAGDTLVVYCAGLGAVDPQQLAGASSPANAARTLDTVRLSIGGVDAPVSFAGLTPGLVGLYQVNAVVPAQAPAGSQVPMTIEVSGQTSPSALIAIK